MGQARPGQAFFLASVSTIFRSTIVQRQEMVVMYPSVILDEYVSTLVP